MKAKGFIKTNNVQSFEDYCSVFLLILLQIDINGELQQKTVRSAQRYLAGKEVFSNIFDEAQLSVFKELLPYWAGFRKTYSPPEDPNKKPGKLIILVKVFRRFQ